MRFAHANTSILYVGRADRLLLVSMACVVLVSIPDYAGDGIWVTFIRACSDLLITYIPKIEIVALSKTFPQKAEAILAFLFLLMVFQFIYLVVAMRSNELVKYLKGRPFVNAIPLIFMALFVTWALAFMDISLVQDERSGRVGRLVYLVTRYETGFAVYASIPFFFAAWVWVFTLKIIELAGVSILKN